MLALLVGPTVKHAHLPPLALHVTRVAFTYRLLTLVLALLVRATVKHAHLTLFALHVTMVSM
jgi:hypothetical protein